MTGRGPVVLVLMLAGAAWGATQPLAKIAVSQGYRHFGILFWQLLLTALLLGVLTGLRGRRLPLSSRHLRFYLLIGLIGSVLPGIAAYTAAIHLPSGVLSILLSSVPMLTFPMALALGLERFRATRFLGLCLGLSGVALLVLPDSSLPDPATAIWIPVALIASAFYALEANVVARWGTLGLDPIRVLFGASFVGCCLTLPLALATGQFIDPRGPWGTPDGAIVALTLFQTIGYTSYVWLINRAGSVFSVQVSYFVTLFGVVWAMLFLGESYSGYIWAALVAMLGGLTLVQPRAKSALVPAPQPGQNGSDQQETGHR